MDDLKIDKKSKLTEGDTLYLMHWVASKNGGKGDWVLMETELVPDTITGKLRAKALFNAEDKLSPIVFIARQNANGGTTVTPIDPTDPVIPDPTDPSNPSVDNGGKITIDDIANAVVKKLQASNTKVVRVSSNVSPKTGE